jgi:hypothetical protein
MIDLDDDEDGLSAGPVVVRRAIYDETEKLQAEREPGAPSSVTIAAGRAQSYQDEGDNANAALWGEIHHYLMELECVRADASIIILEAGETWDWQLEKVVGPTK